MRINIAVAVFALGGAFVLCAVLPLWVFKVLVGLAVVVAAGLLGTGYYRHYSRAGAASAAEVVDQ